MTQANTLKSYERLKSLKLISRLFNEGDKQFIYPYRIAYLIEKRAQDEWPVKFAVSVPKKKIRSAVKRNLLKRRTREAYRMHKHQLQELVLQSDLKIALMFVYIDSDIKKYSVIEKAVKRHLNAISQLLTD